MMESIDVEQCYDCAITIAKEAGKMICDAFHKTKSIEEKQGPCDLVTETDKAVEEMAFSKLREVFPSHNLIGEESSTVGTKVNFTDTPTWIIDPVDGTMNFVHSFPYTCISIALWVGKKPALAVIYNPVLDHMYTAKKGQGAFLNGKRITTSKQTQLSKALIIAEMWCRPNEAHMKIMLDNFMTLVPKCHGPRGMGSAALNMCMVAQGGADAYLEIGIHAWDMAAGALVVTEAGGVVVDMTGGELDILNRRVLCAASSDLVAAIVPLVQVYEEERD